MLFPCSSLNKEEGMLMGERQYLGHDGGSNGPEAPKHRGSGHQLGERKPELTYCGSKDIGALRQAPAQGSDLLYPGGNGPSMPWTLEQMSLHSIPEPGWP